MIEHIALIGFGEAGSTFAQAGAWRERACAYDIDAARQTVMEVCSVRPCQSAREALAGASLVLSLVTADQALVAVRECAGLLANRALWCDMNSVAPQTKCGAAAAIEAAGGRYVDVAVLAPVEPGRLAVPLLLAGPHVSEAGTALRDAGFSNVRVVSEQVGMASAIKMIRSVMVKGIEALTDEMMAAAAVAGVTDEVLASLDASEKSQPWAQRAEYNLERMQTHGLRRAAEMEESAKTLEALGVEPVMTRGTVLRQRAASRHKDHAA